MRSIQPTFNKQVLKGMTLIELLISITIGLAILAAIGSAYVTSSNLRKERDDRAEVFDASKQVFSRFSYETSMAGYIDYTDFTASNRTPASLILKAGTENTFYRVPTGTTISSPLGQIVSGLLPVFGCDGQIASTANATLAMTPTITMSCNTSTASVTRQSIQFAYQSTANAAISSSMTSLSATSGTNTGEGSDCLQVSTATSKYVINRYFLLNSPSDNTSELYCQGSANTGQQPIARGVEEFVVRYLVAAPGLSTVTMSAGANVSRYLSATEVVDTTLNPVGWASVSAVEICMMTATAPSSSSAATGIVQAQTQRPTCSRQSDGRFADNITRATGDQRLWRRHLRTFTIRNNVYSSPV